MRNLRKIRQTKGLLLSDIAPYCGMSKASISYIERGLQIPGVAVRKSLELYFGERINWLDIPTLDIEAIDPASDWNDTERQFRGLIRRIKSLPDDERQAFLSSAIKHLKNLKK
jgi:transcriptional regulator with XRE-family HTH domain